MPNNELPESLKNRKLRSTGFGKVSQSFVFAVLVCCTTVSLATTVGIIAMLIVESRGFFTNENVSLVEFFTGTEWTIGRSRDVANYKVGIWPLVSGTFGITGIAMLIALPLGLVTAVYLSEYAPQRVRSILKPTLEILAGIPTVVLGYFAVMFITPYLLSWVIDVINGFLSSPITDFQPFNAMSAGIAVGILCIPLVSSLTEDALRAVPKGLREAAYGLGGTRFDVTVKVIIPAALSGIVSAFLLAISRAIGETMIVALAAGSTPTFTADPRMQSQTMTGFIVETFNSENLVPGTIEYYSIYAVAVTLFVLTFTITLIGQLIRMRYREAYQ